jgi:uncharacterized Fe-S center protein
MLRRLLESITNPFAPGDRVGIKVHWGEKGNEGFLSPRYVREIVTWISESGSSPFVFDTTVLYSGGRRTGKDSLKTAAEHGYTEAALGCPVLIGDGMDGRDVMEIPSGYKHFSTVQVAGIIGKADGFVVFSHFKGHIEAAFGGAIKNISMGFSSRAQKQRMHADAHPRLRKGKCNRCGVCAEVCPTGAAVLPPEADPQYDLKTCIGCSQCIALCPQMALKIIWDTDVKLFQERLVETAAALWKAIGKKTLIINALLNITAECDCLEGIHPVIADDYGFIGGNHPLTVDEASLRQIGAEPFDRAHPGLPWQRQFEFAREIGFTP